MLLGLGSAGLNRFWAWVAVVGAWRWGASRWGVRWKATAVPEETFRFPSAKRAKIVTMNTSITEAGTQADARLLVVEDEPNILELLSASLGTPGST